MSELAVEFSKDRFLVPKLRENVRTAVNVELRQDRECAAPELVIKEAERVPVAVLHVLP